MGAFHRLLHPRPVVLITSVGKNGKPNIMSATWVTPVSKNPPLIIICVGESRYSHKLIEETGAFVVNIPTKDLLEQVELCGSESGRYLDKFEASGLTAKPAKTVKPPIIEECIGHLECRVVNKFSAGDHTIFVGEVLAAYADEGLFVEIYHFPINKSVKQSKSLNYPAFLICFIRSLQNIFHLRGLSHLDIP